MLLPWILVINHLADQSQSGYFSSSSDKGLDLPQHDLKPNVMRGPLETSTHKRTLQKSQGAKEKEAGGGSLW